MTLSMVRGRGDEKLSDAEYMLKTEADLSLNNPPLLQITLAVKPGCLGSSPALPLANYVPFRQIT